MDNISSVFLVNRQLNRFKFLLWSLFMLIGLRPLLSEWLGGGRIWADVLADSFFACALMSGLHAVSGQPRQQNLAAFLTVAIVVLGILHYLLQISVLDKLQQALSAIFLLQMLVMIWVHINQSTEITLELIMAAACAYILLGMSWAYGYFFLELASPESFKISDKLDDDLWNYYYYSFVTLTTVGYGDIVAVSKSARALTILEAIIGQLYLAIMISRLVGLHTAQLRSGQE